ncbi:hypothetical protein X731_16325 [Mesorhizobium sp. L2C054A000]|nr:hypothetical protein [Mesorhizobium sp. L2C054A000]ESZ46250.1 hypothetical protein X731_16325 [Mesorhizobium sp. L2C054A000]
MPFILDQWGQPVLISQQRAFIGDDDVAPVEIDHGFKERLDQRTSEYYAGVNQRLAGVRETVSPFDQWKAQRDAKKQADDEAERAEIEKAKTAGHAKGYAEGIVAGKQLGRKAVDQQMMDIVRGAHGNGALAQAALELALDAPDLSAAVALSIAGRGVRGSASLANRDTLPDSLAIAKSQLAGA